MTRDKPVRLLATWFGAGYSPVAPGTAGTAAAIPLYALLAMAGPGWVVAGAVVVAVIGIPAAKKTRGRLWWTKWRGTW